MVCLEYKKRKGVTAVGPEYGAIQKMWIAILQIYQIKKKSKFIRISMDTVSFDFVTLGVVYEFEITI